MHQYLHAASQAGFVVQGSAFTQGGRCRLSAVLSEMRSVACAIYSCERVGFLLETLLSIWGHHTDFWQQATENRQMISSPVSFTRLNGSVGARAINDTDIANLSIVITQQCTFQRGTRQGGRCCAPNVCDAANRAASSKGHQQSQCYSLICFSSAQPHPCQSVSVRGLQCQSWPAAQPLL